MRHRDTGAIRELSPAQWREARLALEAEGFMRVIGPDDLDHPDPGSEIPLRRREP